MLAEWMPHRHLGKHVGHQLAARSAHHRFGVRDDEDVHTQGDGTISATCAGADGSSVEVTISGLYQTRQGIFGKLSIVVRAGNRSQRRSGCDSRAGWANNHRSSCDSQNDRASCEA
jgi:hypothetical protein